MRLHILPITLITILSFQSLTAIGQVKVYESALPIPTWIKELDTKNTSSDQLDPKTWPYPQALHTKGKIMDKIYNALILENDFLKVCILPELGGRVYYIQDKSNNKDLISRTEVIQPVNRDLSGDNLFTGLDWTWTPQGGLPFDQEVSYRTEENADGSKTIWTGGFEKYHQSKWLTGFTLHPGKSYLEISIRYLNTTPALEPFQIYANLYLPETSKEVFIHIPEKTNQEVLREGFCAAIDPLKNSGLVVIANPHFFSAYQDQPITGPAIQAIHLGMYTRTQDQPSWIAPFGSNSGSIYLYPIKDIHSVTAANKELALNLDQKNGKVIVEILSTSKLANYRLLVSQKGKIIYTADIDPDPNTPVTREIKTAPGELSISLLSADNEVVLEYQTTPQKENTLVGNNSAEQIAPSTVIPIEKQLQLDSLDLQANIQMGITQLKPGKYVQSQFYFNRACKQLSNGNQVTRNGEPFYYQGLNYFYQGEYDAASESFYKSVWSQEWTSPGNYMLAVIDCLNGKYNDAIEKLGLSYSMNSNHIDALNLMAIILRRNGEDAMAQQTLKEAQSIDPLNYTTAFEQYQFDKPNLGMQAAINLRKIMGDDVDNYLETASRYMMAGFYSDAAELLHIATATELIQTSRSPLIYYYLGYCYSKVNEKSNALEMYGKASGLDKEHCFPYGHFTYLVLSDALIQNDKDNAALELISRLLGHE